MERICVYPGSFDPVTLGHEDVIRRAAKLFDRLIVAVMHNPQKTGCFPVQERMALLEKLTRDLPNVTIIEPSFGRTQGRLDRFARARSTTGWSMA